jgi:ribosomal protein S18 acetylase RimI-like enzyme
VWRAAEIVPSVSDDTGSLRRLLDTSDDALLIAEVDDRMVGTLIAAWDGWRGNLYRLAVLPSWRRRGIARQLIVEGERRQVARFRADQLHVLCTIVDEPCRG